MTYTSESRPSVYTTTATYTIVPPPRTPVATSNMTATNGRLNVWNKENQQQMLSAGDDGYYYSRHDLQLPNRLRAASNAVAGRPQLYNSPRYPPFPSTETPPTIYMNVPTMPRAKLVTNGVGVYEDGKTAAPQKSSKKREEPNVVWGSRKEDNGMVYGNSRLIGGTTINTTTTSSNSLAAVEKKRSTARRKPKWGRCMQTLFCCISPPPRENGKISGRTTHQNNGTSSVPASTTNANGSAQSPPPIQLITQVQKDGTVTGLPTTGPIQNEKGEQPPTIAELSDTDKPLLPPLRLSDSNKKCLIIDLDETLVHSSFKPVKDPDFVIPVEIEGVDHQVYVLKRPHVDEFLARVGEMFECVLFTASLAKYADPVANLLDKKRVFRTRLFREACVFHKGNYVKDLSRLGRDLNQTLIIDNSPASYAFHPENAVPISTWFDDPSDCELLTILDDLERINEYASVYDCLRPEEMPTDPLL